MQPRFVLILAAVFCASLTFPRRAMSAEPVRPTPADTAPAVYSPVKTLNTSRTFPEIKSRAEWEARRERIRQQALVSCGLYPLPPKTPLQPHIFGRVQRDGYTIEKVYFQTYPGFYLAGNLYRPFATEHFPRKTSGRVPGILVTHGHWAEGRMANTEAGSIPARAITFARMGCVAFTYDMVGYNDTRQIPGHYETRYAGDREHWLWSVSLMGLQTWNSIRALDFISSLPDVDKSRLAITGESGGGTQTMLLGAVDDRLAAVGPCVMVSHTMQGGCLCENAPGLRVDYSNMEIAAMAAPRPQIMVGASGDWTTTMMTVEGPAVESIYKLYGAADKLKYVRFNFNHNINKTSRDAVYQFFGKVLLHDPSADSFTEPPYTMEPVADLRVFPDDKPLPRDAKSAEQLTAYLKTLGEERLEKAKPADKRSLAAFEKLFRPLWEHTLGLDPPDGSQIIERPEFRGSKPGSRSFAISRPDGGPDIPVRMIHNPEDTPNSNGKSQAVVLLDPRGWEAFPGRNDREAPMVEELLKQGNTVVIPALFLQPGRTDAAVSEARHKALANFGQFFTTYNRTDLQERVQEIATICTYLRNKGYKRVSLVGMHEAGILAMLAAPLADRVVADCNHLDLTTDEALLTDDLFVPGLRRMGDFRTALTLAAPHPLLLHGTGAKFTPAHWVEDVYSAVGSSAALKIEMGQLDENAILNWLAQDTR